VTARVCGPRRERTSEHASKRTMCRPTRQRYRGRLIRLGEVSEDDAQPLGTGGSTHTRSALGTVGKGEKAVFG
jgi:hypothetical protein